MKLTALSKYIKVNLRCIYILFRNSTSIFFLQNVNDYHFNYICTVLPIHNIHTEIVLFFANKLLPDCREEEEQYIWVFFLK